MSASLLGCVLAGGQSTRFGSDKALATLNGRTLLDHSVLWLESHCGAVIAAGRDDARVLCVPDWPESGLGPLGGLAGALRHAAGHGHDALLTIGVDSLGLPDDLPALLAPGPSCLSAQPVVGLWPVAVLGVLEEILTGGERRSMIHFAERCGARLVDTPSTPANVNTPEDLARLIGKGDPSV